MKRIYIEGAYREQGDYYPVTGAWDKESEMVTLNVVIQLTNAPEQYMTFEWGEWLDLVAFVTAQYEAAQGQEEQ